jgi:hypothetical protein
MKPLRVSQHATFYALLIGLAFCFVLGLAGCGTAVPYAEFGAYHYLGTTDIMIKNNPKFGGDTFSIIEAGIEIDTKEKWYFLWSDQIDIGIHHLSHPDRGYPVNDTEEAYLDGAGMKFRWKADSLRF